jgi:hypothetical protein
MSTSDFVVLSGAAFGVPIDRSKSMGQSGAKDLLLYRINSWGHKELEGCQLC